MNKNRKYINFVPYIFVAMIILMLGQFAFSSDKKSFSYNEFKSKAPNLEFKDVDVAVGSVVLDVNGTYLEDGVEVAFTVTLPRTEEDLKWITEVTSEELSNSVLIKDPNKDSFWKSVLWNIVPLIPIVLIAIWLFSKMNNMQSSNNKAFDFTKSRAKIEGDVPTRFDDVAGCDEEKEEVAEIIDYLKSPKKFADMGARIPKGILMVGPPGTGKTLLAKAVAGEANVPFFSISGSDFVEMFVGTGASRVRDMFKKAKQAAPCIIFIDEIDAVGRQRGAGMGGGNDEREQTLNQLLVEMDGMSENTGIVIIAATNRQDVLDPALQRSGRFDRTITVNLPDKKGRTEVLQVHARNKKLDPDVNLENLAKRTPGFSGADLENVLNEGAILAVRDNRKTITMHDLDEAIDRVMMGPAKKSKKYSVEDKRLVAYHEAGHAVIGLKLENADIVQKITIIPRGEAGGYNLMTPKEEKWFTTKSDYLAQITGLLGGRASEEIVFNEITGGAYDDIRRVTQIAKTMVRVIGMSSLGPIQYGDPNGNVFLGRDYGSSSEYSGEIAFEIDKEIRKIVNECHETAKEVLRENRALLDLIAETLIEEETITNEQINNLVAYGSIHSPEEAKELKEKEAKAAASDIVVETTIEKAEPNIVVEKKVEKAQSDIVVETTIEKAESDVVVEKKVEKPSSQDLNDVK